MAEEILELEVNSNVRGVTRDVDDLTDAVESANTSYTKLNDTVNKTNKAQDEGEKLLKRSIGNFRVFGFSLRDISKSFKMLRPLSRKLFMTIKSGIAATGIGVLLIAFGVLMGALMGTKKGAKIMDLAMQGIKKVLEPLIWVIEKVADGLASLFGIDSSPAVRSANELEKAYERLGETMDEIALKEAKNKKNQFDNKRIINDITKSEEARLQASKDNADFNEQQTKKEIEEQERVLKANRKELEEKRERHVLSNKAIQISNSEYEKQRVKEHAKRTAANFERSINTIRFIKKIQAEEIKLADLRAKLHTQEIVASDEITKIKSFNIDKLDDEDAQSKADKKIAADKWRKKQEKIAADELSIAKQLEHIKQELYYRTLKTTEEVEAAKLKYANDTAKQTILDSKASKKVKDAAIKELDIKYFDDLAVIVDKYEDKAKEKTKAADEKLVAIRQENMLLAIDDERKLADKKLEIQKDAELKSVEEMENAEELKTEIKDKYSKIQGKINVKRGEDDKKIADASTSDQIAAFGNLAGALSGLAGDNKELAAASAIIDTYAGATKAFAQGGTAGFITGAAIIAAGLANVQKIYATDVGDGGGGGGGDVASVPPAPQMMSGAFTLGGGQAVEPARAYVVSDDITNNQNKLAIIRRRATI